MIATVPFGPGVAIGTGNLRTDLTRCFEATGSRLFARRFARRLYDGDIALMYIVWYGAVRSLLEGYRDNNWYIGPLPTAVWIGVAGIILAGGFLILRHLRGWGRPGAWMDRSDAPDAPDPPPQPATEPSPG